jgi:hypothetical protein
MIRTFAFSLLALLVLASASAVVVAQGPPAEGDVIVDLPAPRPVPVPAPVRALTLGEFANSFKPAAGCHEVLLVNPVTCCPVWVKFTLPCGCPKVCVSKREVKFNYGRSVVRIRFRLRGRLVVIYR